MANANHRQGEDLRAADANVISLRQQLSKSVGKFLRNESMACAKTEEALVALICALAHYRDEGRALFPEVFLFDKLTEIVSQLPEAEFIRIGTGKKDADTAANALRKCAPLARRGWSVYLERTKAGFTYGLLRCGSSALSLSPAELLVNRGLPEVPAMIIRQVAENVIELRGVNGSSLIIHFGATDEHHPSPIPTLRKFAACLARDVDLRLQEQLQAFYELLLLGILRAGHGTLAAVVSARRRVTPNAFRDCVELSPPISIASRVEDVLRNQDLAANSGIQACAAIVTGMLLSDGVTLFGTDGTVRAYRAFLRHPRTTSATHGGARMRTFSVMAQLVGTELAGAFMQSQDGRIEFKGSTR